MNLSERIDSIELKIRELAFKLERLKKENAVLREENQELKAEAERLRQQPAEALNDNVNQKSRLEPEAQPLAETEQSEKLREQIDQYIQEIDKCIEWLNNN